MARCLIVSLLVVLACSSIHADIDFTTIPISSVYSADKTDCFFPFTFNGKNYTDCTNDGDNSLIPWCSLTPDYQGVATYCYDFRKPKIKCSDTYKVNGKSYSGCQYFSKSAMYKQCKTDNDDLSPLYCPDAMYTPKKQYKPHRQRDCDPSYKKMSEYHTMCFAPSDFAIPIAINDTEKDDILTMHNSYRSAVPSKRMYKLHWDNELAKLAQARADLCFFDHDLATNRKTLVYNWKNGQNMIVSSEVRSSLDSLIDMMLGAEKERFIYGVGCTTDGSCLHYTQAMISEMTRVGCAHTHCVYPDRIERYLVCNYIQSQYVSKYKTPYEEADAENAASDCPLRNEDGLCNCNNTICDYSTNTEIDPTTCKCRPQMVKRSADELIEPRKVFAPTGLLEERKRKRRGLIDLSERGSIKQPKLNGEKHLLEKDG